MLKVVSLPAGERQILLNKIKKSVDQTEAICSDGSCNDDVTNQAEVKQTTVNTPLTRTSQRKLPSNAPKRRPIPSNNIPAKPLLVLACPVCELKFTNWTSFSNHLHTGHSQSTVSSVCRRCHGIFRNHALLLAHECFKWGRNNLPCSTVYSSIEDSPILKDFGFPSEGIYFERRCGLCLTSDVVYSNFEQYERHKYEEHAESGSRAPICDIQRPQNKSFQAPASALLPGKPRRKIKKSKVEKPTTANRPVAPIHTEELPSETVEETEVPIAQQTESSTSADNSATSQNVFFCRVCKLFFRTRERLLRHEKKSAVHNRRQLNRCKRLKLAPVPESALGRPWECKECGLMYTRKHGLERHVAFVHHGETAFRCEFCNFHALDRANFRQHMSRHFHLKNFACEHCDHRCITKQELEDHVRFKHSDKRDFKCPDCQATFKTPGTLSRHQKTHTNVSYVCNECNASFNRMSNLKRHKESLHSSSAENRRNRGRPKKDVTSRQKQTRKAALHEQRQEQENGEHQSHNFQQHQQSLQNEQHQGHLPVAQGAIVGSGLEPMWDYEATRIHSVSGDRLCTTVTSTAVIEQPVYVVTFETESGWIPACSVASTTNLTDESLLLHPPPPSSQLSNHPPPRSDTVLPCVSDFFSSFLTSGSTTATTNVQQQSPSHPNNSENVHHQSTSSNHQHHHIWRSDGDVVDDLANVSAVGTDDLICDFLNCEVVTAEEDVEASGCSENVGTNFSVGYLIGGGGGGSGNGMIEQDGSRTGEELHTLPTSDCLSLVPIVTTAFEDSSSAAVNNNTQVHGTRAFHPFWTSTSSNGSSGECAANAQSGIIHEEYGGFEQHENDM